MNIGNIATLPNEDTHWRIFHLTDTIVSLESYGMNGRDTQYISVRHFSENRCKVISEKETKQFLELKALYNRGRESFLHNEDAKRKARTMKNLYKGRVSY